MQNNISQNPSNAGDDNNLWPDWNAARGVGKAPRGDAGQLSFDEIRENSREGARALAKQAAEAQEAADQPAFAFDADSYQPAKGASKKS